MKLSLFNRVLLAFVISCSLCLTSSFSVENRETDLYVEMACNAVHAGVKVCQLETDEDKKRRVALELAQMIFIYYCETRNGNVLANDDLDRVIKQPYTISRLGGFGEFSNQVKSILENPFPGEWPDERRVNSFVMRKSEYEKFRLRYLEFITEELEGN